MFKNNKNLISMGFNSIKFPKLKPINIFNTPNKSMMKTYKNKGFNFLNKRFGLNPLLDSDRDGVINMFDCRPFDKRRQDLNKLQKARIGNLPIFVTDRPINYGNPTGLRSSSIMHVSESPKRIKHQVYGMFKHYPSLMGEIERKKPRAIVYTTKDIESGQGRNTAGFAMPTEQGSARGSQEGKGVAFIQLERKAYAKPSQGKYGRWEREETATTTRHELEHVKQFKTAEQRPSLAAKYFKGRYSQQLGEKQARESESNLVREYPEMKAKEVEQYAEQTRRPKLKEKAKVWLEKYKRYKEEREQRKEAGLRRITNEENIENEKTPENEGGL